MRQVIFDASAGVELLLDTPRGAAIADQMPPSFNAWVPGHYYLEVASALRRAERRGTASRADVTAALVDLGSSQLVRVGLRLLLHGAWARRGHMTIGDAFYVVLAEELGATLVTADKNLANAPGIGVPTITP